MNISPKLFSQQISNPRTTQPTAFRPIVYLAAAIALGALAYLSYIFAKLKVKPLTSYPNIDPKKEPTDGQMIDDEEELILDDQDKEEFIKTPEHKPQVDSKPLHPTTGLPLFLSDPHKEPLTVSYNEESLPPPLSELTQEEAILSTTDSPNPTDLHEEPIPETPLQETIANVSAKPPLNSDFYLNLELLRAYVKQSILSVADVDGNLFSVRYYSLVSELSQIVCQTHPLGISTDQTEKIAITFDKKGTITTITIDDNPIESPNEIPDIWQHRLEMCFQKALELSSDYTSSIIKVVPRTLHSMSEFHLDKFANLISMQRESLGYLSFVFKNNDLTNKQGIDGGGLTRHYFTSLFEGITHSKWLNFHLSAEFHRLIPQANPASQGTVPSLTEKEKQLYRQMGVAIMYCYRSTSNKYPSIGPLFDDVLFDAMFCLTTEEINTPFELLSDQTKLKMCEALILGKINAGEPLHFLLKRIQVCLPDHGFNSETIEEIASHELHALALPKQFIKNNQVNIEAVHANMPAFITHLTQEIYSHQSDSLGTLGSTLAPLHAIAAGMFSMLPKKSLSPISWPKERPTHEVISKFTTKVQGSLDRLAICNQIKAPVILSAEVKKKKQWMEEWILNAQNGATESELKNFLKYFTGSTSIIPGEQIKIEEVNAPLVNGVPDEKKTTPIPKSSTCSRTIYLSTTPSGSEESYSDHTKEGFFKILRELDTNSGSFNVS